MSIPISLFDYNLPTERIAQAPVEPRDSSRLLVLEREGKGRKGEEREGKLEHRRFFEIIDYLKSGDVLVMNDTKVFKARLHGEVRGKKIEVFLLPPTGNSPSLTAAVGEGLGERGLLVGEGKGRGWNALLKPSRKVKIDDEIDFGELKAKVINKAEDGTVLLFFERNNSLTPPLHHSTTPPLQSSDILSFTDKHGEIPVPPYVKKIPDNLEAYQTVYARETGSVAAPTAGFHFTKELLEKIKEKGITIEFVTLHVGLGTFRPVKSETLEEHKMHSELVEIKKDVAHRINDAKKAGQRIIAVGTTTTRALEGVAMTNNGSLPESGFLGEVNIFITPGFKFNIIDALITNFHLPKSTLLVLISALAGRENVIAAYEEAVKENYRFYSFGDAMFIC